MEEKKNSPESSSSDHPPADIDSLLKEMVKKAGPAQNENPPADTKTPSSGDQVQLTNLKNILSHADAAVATPLLLKAEIREDAPIKATIDETAKNSQPTPEISLSMNLDFLTSGPVAHLDELLKAHRAKKLKGA